MLTIILIVLLVFLLAGALPVFPYSRQWGYGPVGVLLFILVLILILSLLGLIPLRVR